MRQSRCNLGGLLLVTALTAPALSAAQVVEDDPPDPGGATFLLVPVGGKAAALGQAATADGGSSEAVFWNPAGLAGLPRTQFLATSASLYGLDIKEQYASLAIPSWR